MADKKLNWKIVGKKAAIGAVQGAVAAMTVSGLVIGSIGWLPVLGTALLVGALQGGLNAFKHRKG